MKILRIYSLVPRVSQSGSFSPWSSEKCKNDPWVIRIGKFHPYSSFGKIPTSALHFQKITRLVPQLCKSVRNGPWDIKIFEKIKNGPCIVKLWQK